MVVGVGALCLSLALHLSRNAHLLLVSHCSPKLSFKTQLKIHLRGIFPASLQLTPTIPLLAFALRPLDVS